MRAGEPIVQQTEPVTMAEVTALHQPKSQFFDDQDDEFDTTHQPGLGRPMTNEELQALEEELDEKFAAAKAKEQAKEKAKQAEEEAKPFYFVKVWARRMLKKIA